MLSGVRVLDLTRVLAGPFATMVLGDMGAEIIKIENPNGGDDTRSWGPPFVGKETAYFVSINRNKKSVAVNMKDDRGADLVRNLARKSDILVENFLPGKLDSMGLGYDQLRTINEQLIYCSITGYGPDGPYANRGGYDVIASSIGGLNYITGPENGDPCRVGVAMTDMSTGLFAHGAILAALFSREKTGKGQKIDCNLLSTQVAILSHIASNYLNAGVEAKRRGTAHSSIVPYQAFKTKDQKLVTIGAGNNKHFAQLCKLLNLEYLLEDERFKDNASRVQNRNSLLPIIKKRFAENTSSHWLHLFEGCSFPFGPINSVGEALNDPQVLHNKLIQEIEHPGAGGRIRVVGPPVKFSKPSSEEPLRPPLLGEHTREVLCELTDITTLQFDILVEDNILKDGSTSI